MDDGMSLGGALGAGDGLELGAGDGIDDGSSLSGVVILTGTGFGDGISTGLELGRGPPLGPFFELFSAPGRFFAVTSFLPEPRFLVGLRSGRGVGFGIVTGLAEGP